jgi:hypothetical protein
MKKQIIISSALVSILLAIMACSTTQVIQPTRASIEPTTASSAPTKVINPIVVVPTETQGNTQVQPTEVKSVDVATPSTNTLDGKALVSERCTTCHGLGPVQRKHTASDWQFLVADMIDRGAQLNTDEQAAVLKYLTTTYGR